MTDHDLRSAQRAAATGGLKAAANYLRARQRTGDISRERILLAAYCGSNIARAVADWPHNIGGLILGPCGWETVDLLGLNTWFKGLVHQPIDVGVLKEEQCKPEKCMWEPRAVEWRRDCGCAGAGKRHAPWKPEEHLALQAACATARVMLAEDERYGGVAWCESQRHYVHAGDALTIVDCEDPIYGLRETIRLAEIYLKTGKLKDREEWGYAWAATGPGGLREGPQWLPVPGYPPILAIRAAIRVLDDGERIARDVSAKKIREWALAPTRKVTT